ncbi:MAG: hypothetical protein HY713_06505 [candidate division NC10 bacterium]|nr:hypothetical protein [candidate division NC10 bacterium]
MDTLLQQIQAFLSLPREARTRQGREALLQALGVPQPSRFIEEVWTSQWEAGIDRLLDPANTRIRPLEPTDFHFKWALEAFNGLPAPVRARLFTMKMEANGLRGPVLALLDAAGLSTHAFEVTDLVALSKVHAEAAATVRIHDGRTCQCELSHFAPEAEALYAGAARLFRLRTATTYIHPLPTGRQILLEVPLHGIRLDDEDLPQEEMGRLWPLAIRGVARHDALGDVLGTILRDPHHILTGSGEVVSIHNYELFHDIGGFRFGFVEPIFLSLWRRLRGPDRGEERAPLRRMFEEYRRAYVEKRQEIQVRWSELEAYLTAHGQAIREYLKGQQDWSEVVAAVRERAFRDPAQWVRTLLEPYRESYPDLPEV